MPHNVGRTVGLRAWVALRLTSRLLEVAVAPAASHENQAIDFAGLGFNCGSTRPAPSHASAADRRALRAASVTAVHNLERHW
jgi:hypothetical protein